MCGIPAKKRHKLAFIERTPFAFILRLCAVYVR
jgi:hypothetical protein